MSIYQSWLSAYRSLIPGVIKPLTLPEYAVQQRIGGWIAAIVHTADEMSTQKPPFLWVVLLWDCLLVWVQECLWLGFLLEIAIHLQLCDALAGCCIQRGAGFGLCQSRLQN